MTSAFITACLLFSATGYSSSPKNSFVEMTTREHGTTPTSSREEQAPGSSAGILSSPSFAITMPNDLLTTLEDQEIKEKTRQMYISAGATTVLSALTIYYASTTNPSEWLSGTAGSYCTNTVLTAMATNFLRRDRNSLQKKQAALKK